MKKLTILLIAVLFSTMAVAQNFTEIKSSEIPKKATTYIKQNFPNFELGRAGKVDIKGTTKYAIVVDSRGRKSILVFDKTGNYLERVKKIDEISSEVKNAPKSTPPATKPPTNTDPPPQK